MESKLITVIVPIYNVERYLSKCIESIVNQSYIELQIILVDDGSTDGCGDICDDYLSKDSRIEVIHKKNGGLRSARIAGLEYSKGDYTTFVDADDWIEYDCLEKLMKINEDYEADIIAYSHIQDYIEKHFVFNNLLNDGYYDKKWIEDNPDKWFMTDNYLSAIIHPGLCYKIAKTKLLKENIDNIPLDITYGEDAAFFYKYLLKANSILVVNKPLYHYVQRNNSMVHELRELPKNNFIGLYRTLKEAFGDNNFLQKKLKEYIFYTLLMKKYSSIEHIGQYVLFPFTKVKNGMKVFIYGAGKFGKIVHRAVKNNNSLILVGWTDMNYKDSEMLEMNLCTPENIYSTQFDILIIAIINEALDKGIAQDMVKNGIDIEKIDYVKKTVIDNVQIPIWLE